MSKKESEEDMEWEWWKNVDDDRVFIQCYNDFTNIESENFHLDVEQLYIYSLLKVHETIGGVTYLSLNSMERLMPIPYGKPSSYSRNKIKKILGELLEKEIILSNKNIDEVSPPDVIAFQVNKEHIEKNSLKKGFEKIPFRAFFQSSSMYDFYIYCTVHRHRNYGFICSYDGWAEILNCSRRSAIRKVEEAVINKAIFKKMGKYNSENNQEANKYSTLGFEKDTKTSKCKGKSKEYNPF